MWLGVNLRKHQHLKIFGTDEKGVIGEQEKNQNCKKRDKDENNIQEVAVKYWSDRTAVCPANTQYWTLWKLFGGVVCNFLKILSQYPFVWLKTFEELRAFVYVGYNHWLLKVECEKNFKYLLIKSF